MAIIVNKMEVRFPNGKDTHWIFTAYDTEKCLLAGYARLNVENPPAAWLQSIFVPRGYRRRKIATALIKQACAHCTELDFTAISLGCDRKNAKAIKLYEKQGFKLTYVYDKEDQMMSKQL